MTRRRTLMMAGVAVAAASAGVGGYLWQRERSAGSDALWSLDFETLDQGRLAMAGLRGRPLLLNFWATWCPPCVREMPALERFFLDHRAQGWQVLGIAADNAAEVRTFLARTPVSFSIALAGFAGVELSRRLGNVSGGLPFSVLYGRDGAVAQRHMGETRYEQLSAWAKGIS